LFSVRTPTAVVTDLGTEFGVDQRDNGSCNVQVFEGVVEAVATSGGNRDGKRYRLVRGQVARVSPGNVASGSTPRVIVAAVQTGPDKFTRVMPDTVRQPDRVFYSWQLGARGTFSVARDDLINAGQPTLTGIELTSNPSPWLTSVRQLNDGDVSYGSDLEEDLKHSFIPSDGAVVTITLNTALHPLGYDIKSIVSLTGSEGSQANQDRSSQKYDVAYSLVGAPDQFITLRCDRDATVDRPAYDLQEEQVTLSCGGRNAPIASGVAKLRLTFHNTGSRNPESMYREIDVFGSPTESPRKEVQREAKR